MPCSDHPLKASRRATGLPALAPATRTGAVVLLVFSLATAGLRDSEMAGAGSSTDEDVWGLPPSVAAAPSEEIDDAPVEREVPRELPTALPPVPMSPEEAANGDLVVPDAADGAATAGTSTSRTPRPPTTPVGPWVGDTARERFASRFPAHAAATQDPARPATTRWAVLVGVNAHTGGIRDNIGSRQDAEVAYELLMAHGWRPDHVLLLTDELATRDALVEALRWLARRTTEESVAVFSYSGHVQQWWGDVDGDGEDHDEGLWPTDSDHVTDGEFAGLLGDIRAGRLWVNLMGCEAAGLLDPGTIRDGLLATFSSAEDEKSYEDPSVGHSVWGWNLLARGMRDGRADADRDGDVTVQEAAGWAIPRAARRTREQVPHGPQNGGMVDRSGGAFSLTLPSATSGSVAG